MANTKKTTRAAASSTKGGTPTTARSGTTGGSSGSSGGTAGGGGGAGVSTQTAPLGIPSGGASVNTAATPTRESMATGGGVNWANVQQQFPQIAWTQQQLASLMTNIALGPQHYSHGEYQAMLTQFRSVCGQQIQLFERLHLGSRELVNA